MKKTLFSPRCQKYEEKVGDFQPGEVAMKLQRFPLILQKNDKLNATHYTF